ncbi:sodium/glutamate symporter [Faecalispora jeddahensis]|uniref:sodium/glutamate symporter n=1 Tax=Faecalispora jeddahensis TaxID=1414721 RepID=UPI00189BD667|nr:sodium/glutamate symporter [Faecalispora jeddahensis]
MGVLKGVIDIGTNDAGMTTIGLNMYLAAGLAALLFWLGNWTVNKVRFLKEKCIPAPLVGGLYFAIVNTILTGSGILNISFNDTLQSFFMLVFFCTVGFTVSIPLLKSGGKSIVIMLLLGTVMTFMQNFLGGGLMSAFGQDPRLGVAAGSVALIGGPGTAAAFGATMDLPIAEGGYGMTTGSIVGITAAVFGLVMGSIMGGPTAYRRIKQFNLKSTDTVVEGNEDGETFNTTGGAFTQAAMLLAVAIGIGQLVSVGLKAATGVTLPGYIGAMLVAACMRNINDARGKKFPGEEIDTIGGLSLNLFLAMAMMSLKLWQLVDLALPLIVALVGQIILMYLFAYYVVFNVMGKNYNAAVQTAGFIGFAMGATSNAMANMQAITKQYGPAREAYFVIPMVGGLFIDFVNAAIITGFLNWWTP